MAFTPTLAQTSTQFALAYLTPPPTSTSELLGGATGPLRVVPGLINFYCSLLIGLQLHFSLPRLLLRGH